MLLLGQGSHVMIITLWRMNVLAALAASIR
jgi:hypothetical protein